MAYLQLGKDVPPEIVKLAKVAAFISRQSVVKYGQSAIERDALEVIERSGATREQWEADMSASLKP